MCGIGGLDEAVSRQVRQYVDNNHAAGSASVFGGGQASPVGAALANGTISHALDYDDTHFSHIGHLSVGVLPAALAVGQETDASLEAVVDAFLVGAESAIRVGLALGADTTSAIPPDCHRWRIRRDHRRRKTLPAVPRETRAALGLCATRASGLKSQFGTMGKPLNAGFAASNGVECAALAALGMTSADDGLEGQQGFIETIVNNRPPRWTLANFCLTRFDTNCTPVVTVPMQ